MKKKSRNDIILIASLCLTAILAGFFLYFKDYFRDSKSELRLEIIVDGEVVDTYEIDSGKDDITITLDTGNTVVISDGEVYMKEADCPDGLCIRQGSISRAGESVICLPHKLVLRIVDVSDWGSDTDNDNDDGLDVMPR